MSYSIECVIRKLEIDASGSLSKLEVKGCEGYLLKQGDKEYNVFCEENLKQAFYFEISIPFHWPSGLNDPRVPFLIQASCANKRVRLTITIDKQDNEKDKDLIIGSLLAKLSSIALIA